MNNKTEKLGKQMKQFERAIARLDDILKKPKDEYFRDSAIQRFEFNYEICWKLLKNILDTKGIIANSPRDVFKGAFQVNLIDQDSLWFQMIEDRNFTTHVYEEDQVEEVYGRLSQYLKLYQGLIPTASSILAGLQAEEESLGKMK